jgi:cation:H+ antiporter
MLINFLLLLTGFIILIKSADLLVNGASALAVKLTISEMAVGLTVVAFGTSTPELIVNIYASLANNAELTFANIIGSNIINILLILGVSGIIYALQTKKNTIWREIPFSLLAGIVLLIMCNDYVLDKTVNILSRSDGVVLLLFFIIFFIYTFTISKITVADKPEIKMLANFTITIFIVGGLLGLILGGKLVVNHAVEIARILGVSEKLIGLTIVSIGTSLPELFTSAVAAYKKKSDIAIGNIVGSNIFNIFFVLGISALIHPISFNSTFNIDIFILIIASLLLFFTMFTGGERTLDRWEAIVLLCLFITYNIFILIRGQI